MPAPFGHVDVGTLMGSWPILPTYSSGGTPYVLPRTLEPRATILGVQRETLAGYSLNGKSFYVWIDPAGGGAPVQKTVSFSTPDPWTLDAVVARINSGACMNEVVASKDNGFLRLTSPRTGESSYLRIETLPASGTSVLVELGLFAETEAKGGQIRQAQHIDPDRQVANPGQLSWMEGEPFDAGVFNRMTFQLGINSDRAGFLLDKKRVAVRIENDVNYTVRSPNPEGIQLSGWVYTGDVSTPSTAVLEKWFAILDADGNELIKENEIEVGGTAYSNYVYAWDTDKKYQRVMCASGPFLPAHGTGDYYVKGTNLASPLNGIRLKITSYISATEVIVNPVNPSTGAKYEINETARTASVKQVLTVRCLVDGVYDKPDDPGAGAQRVENKQGVKHASVGVTRIEKNNRVFCTLANFLPGTNPVRIGDLVEWENAVPDDPYNNNGFYRVTDIIDKQTLELATEDFGPVYLNPNTGGYLGDITVTTDGKFWENPWIRLKAFSDGAIPGPGDAIKVVYLGMSTLRDATDDPVALVGSGVRYNQELDENVQRAILAIIGPSATTITDYLYGDRDNNLENIFNLFWNEHHGDSGRHSIIRPDRINMGPGFDDQTLILRNGPTDTTSDLKAVLRNYADSSDLWRLSAAGYHGIAQQYGSYPQDAAVVGPNLGYSIEIPTPSFISLTTFGVISGGLPLGTYYYRVAAADSGGNESLACAESSVTISSANRGVRVFINGGGVYRFKLYRAATPGGPYDYQYTNQLGSVTFEDYDVGWTSSGVPQTEPEAYKTRLASGTSWVGGKLCVGGAHADATFNVRSYSDSIISRLSRAAGSTFGSVGAEQEGIGSPTYATYMDDGQNPPTDRIVWWSFGRWNGTDWNTRQSWEVRDNTVTFKDGSGNENILFSFLNGGQVTIQNGISGPALTLSQSSGDLLRLVGVNALETVNLGIRSSAGGGNLYVNVGSVRYPFVVDTDTGYTSIGDSTNPDRVPASPVELIGNITVDNAVQFLIAGTPRFLLTSNGPYVPNTLYFTGLTNFRMGPSGVDALINFDDTDYLLYERTSNYFSFVRGGVEKLRIGSSLNAYANLDSTGYLKTTSYVQASTTVSAGTFLSAGTALDLAPQTSAPLAYEGVTYIHNPNAGAGTSGRKLVVHDGNGWERYVPQSSQSITLSSRTTTGFFGNSTYLLQPYSFRPQSVLRLKAWGRITSNGSGVFLGVDIGCSGSPFLSSVLTGTGSWSVDATCIFDTYGVSLTPGTGSMTATFHFTNSSQTITNTQATAMDSSFTQLVRCNINSTGTVICDGVVWSLT